MKRALLLLPLLAACTVPQRDTGTEPGLLPGLFNPEPEVVEPAPLPPQVIAALPVGVPQSVVTRNADGCYLITIERTDPPTGYPLQDATGNRVCDGAQAVAAPLGVAAPLDASASLDATASAAGAAAPLAPAPLVPSPLVPGSITPPAPIVQPSQG